MQQFDNCFAFKVNIFSDFFLFLSSFLCYSFLYFTLEIKYPRRTRNFFLLFWLLLEKKCGLLCLLRTVLRKDSMYSGCNKYSIAAAIGVAATKSIVAAIIIAAAKSMTIAIGKAAAVSIAAAISTV